MDLAGNLDLGSRELVSFVGAGGKKTSMARLLAQGTGGKRVGYTTTTHMPPPVDLPMLITETDEIGDEISKSVTENQPVGFASERIQNPDRVDEKVKGFDPDTIDRLFENKRLDWILVKADGARMREFKAPGDGEPAIPSQSTVLVPVVSAKVFGASLSEAMVHRPKRVAELTKISKGCEITPQIVGSVIADEAGGLKGAPDETRIIPLINKADAVDEQSLAKDALETAFERTDRFEAGLITSFETEHIELLRP